MLVLSIVWLVGGVAISGLAILAALAPAAWWRNERRSRLALLGIGALAALAGGWLGTLLFGRFFSSPTAVWVAVVAVAVVPRALAGWLRRGAGASSL
jgi:hypothetical protein